MVTQQSGAWGISIYFDPTDEINYAPGSMTNWWETRFTFTVSAPSTPGTPIISTPVGTASNAPVTFFIQFVGYNGGQPSSAIISDVETRGDLDSYEEFIDLKVILSLHFKTFHSNAG